MAERKAIKHDKPKRPKKQQLSFSKSVVQEEAKLSPQVIAFCEAYIRNKFNVGLAAEGVGISRGVGLKWIKKPEIQDYIYNKMERTFDETVSDSRVIREINRVGFAKLTDVMSWNNNEITIFPSDTLSPDIAAAIQEVNFEETEYAGKGGAPGKVVRKVRVKLFPNKMEALKLTASMKGMLNQEGRLDAGEVADKIREAMENTTSGLALPTMPSPEDEVRKAQLAQQEIEEPISDIVKH